jgi:hypothetical protein
VQVRSGVASGMIEEGRRENQRELAKFENVKKVKEWYLAEETRSTASHEEIA